MKARDVARRVRRRLREARGIAPRITVPLEHSRLDVRADAGRGTVLLPVTSSYDDTVPNAYTSITRGYQRAFASLGYEARVLPARRVGRALEAYPDAVVMHSAYTLQQMGDTALRRSAEARSILWVDPSSDRVRREFRSLHGVSPVTDVVPDLMRRVEIAAPRLFWAPVGTAGLDLYEDWTRRGVPFEQILLGFDSDVYYYDPEDHRFEQVEVLYIGGYWQEKARDLDRYLRPLEGHLTIFGYESWPYAAFGGQISIDEERAAYQNAGVVPLVTGPVGRAMAEITERYFKASACHGLGIADTNPIVREIFTPEEVPQPESVQEFLDLVREALAHPDRFLAFRDRAYEAVHAHHTYRHRARQILSLLGEVGVPA